MTNAIANAADPGTEAQKQAGKELYEKYCVQCHGQKGDGLGVGAAFFRPAPRDFTRGKYKIRTTESGALPKDEDIVYAIREGLAFKPGMAYTGMPPWPQFTNEEMKNLVYYLKSFSSDFEDPEYNNPRVILTGEVPPYSEESAKKGQKVFDVNECIKCHGVKGRGDGRSAPTLKDDWDFPIQPTDLTKPWTFRAGSNREDIFRTISTGFNGTPMPAYEESVSVEDRWNLVDYLVSLASRKTANYNKPDKPIVVKAVSSEIDFSNMKAAKFVFEGSEPAFIPIVGQVIQPGRSFFTGVNEIEVRALYNPSEIAILLRWHDMNANIKGENSPTLEVPRFDPTQKVEEAEESDDPFADFEEEDPFAEDEDFFGEGEEEEEVKEKFSDAIAIQIPAKQPEGFKKPYFLFGDKEQPVEIWFSDLAKKSTDMYLGKGSKALVRDDTKEISVLTEYHEGEWTAIFRRKRVIDNGISFEGKTFTPIAFSVWDGQNEERGNKRGITAWYNLYFEPMEKESLVLPMMFYGGGLLLLELLVIGFVRKRYSKD